MPYNAFGRLPHLQTVTPSLLFYIPYSPPHQTEELCRRGYVLGCGNRGIRVPHILASSGESKIYQFMRRLCTALNRILPWKETVHDLVTNKQGKVDYELFFGPVMRKGITWPASKRGDKDSAQSFFKDTPKDKREHLSRATLGQSGLEDLVGVIDQLLNLKLESSVPTLVPVTTAFCALLAAIGTKRRALEGLMIREEARKEQFELELGLESSTLRC